MARPQKPLCRKAAKQQRRKEREKLSYTVSSLLRCFAASRPKDFYDVDRAVPVNSSGWLEFAVDQDFAGRLFGDGHGSGFAFQVAGLGLGVAAH